MRKLSIVLLVGLMLIGGLSVGIYAQSDNASETAQNATPDSSVTDGTVSTNAEAQINTIVALYVHGNVNLGTLDSASFDSSTGDWNGLDALESTDGNTVKAFSNAAYTVSVKISDNGVNHSDFQDLGDFKFTADADADSISWSAFGGTGDGNSIEVFDTNDGASIGSVNSTNVGYKYVVDSADSPGTYDADLTYTISTK